MKVLFVYKFHERRIPCQYYSRMYYYYGLKIPTQRQNQDFQEISVDTIWCFFVHGEKLMACRIEVTQKNLVGRDNNFDEIIHTAIVMLWVMNTIVFYYFVQCTCRVWRSWWAHFARSCRHNDKHSLRWE